MQEVQFVLLFSSEPEINNDEKHCRTATGAGDRLRCQRWHEIARLDHGFERGLRHRRLYHAGYRCALVCGSDKSCLWILAREPKLEAGMRKALIARAAALGFATEGLISVDHRRAARGEWRGLALSAGDPGDEGGHVIEGQLGEFEVGRVAAALEQHRRRRPAGAGDDPLDLGRGAVLVVPPLEHQERRLNRRQQVLDRPEAEGGIEPGPAPGGEHALGLVAVVAGKAIQPAGGEGLLGGGDAGEGEVIDHDMGGLGDDAYEPRRAGGAVDQGDAAAVGMTDQQVRPLRQQGGKEAGQFAQGVLVHEMDRPGVLQR